MDPVTLAASLTTALAPLLPYLLKAGETAAEETGKTVATKTLDWAKSIWDKLKPKVEAKPAALEAAQDVARAPEDKDLQATLRVQFKKMLADDDALAEEVSRWLDKGKAAGIVSASERGVAIGGDATNNTIVTGDSNWVKP